MFYLCYGRLQGRHFLQLEAMGVGAVDAVEADAEPHHVHLQLWKTDDSRRVGDMPEERIIQCCLEAMGSFLISRPLRQRKTILLRLFAGSEMAEGAEYFKSCSRQYFHQLIEVFGGKTKAIHSRLQLDVHGEGRDALFFQPPVEGMQKGERIDHRFEIVFHQRVEAAVLRVHDHDGHTNAAFAQDDPFVRIGHTEIVHSMKLEHARNLYTAAGISKGLYHGHHPGSRL